MATDRPVYDLPIGPSPSDTTGAYPTEEPKEEPPRQGWLETCSDAEYYRHTGHKRERIGE